MFLSEASNEEIVSISKELTDEISSQVRTVGNTALTLLAISLISLILSISLVADLSGTLSGATKNTIFLLRMISIAFLCLTALIAYLVVSKTTYASSYSALMWRRIRETASDETVYEHMGAVRGLNYSLASSKNLSVLATLTLVLAGLFLGMSYIYQMMAVSGYL